MFCIVGVTPDLILNLTRLSLFAASLSVNGKRISLTLCDTAGQVC